jgi:4-hydroxy-3-methylbut-2-enyl diphosphate reductase
VIGSQNSSNSQRLKDLAIEKGKASYLIDSASDLKEDWFKNIKSVGISAGASAPEDLVQELIVNIQNKYGVSSVEEIKTIDEDVHFALPKILQEASPHS